MDLSCTFLDKQRFQSKIKIFSTPVYLAPQPQLAGYPWNWVPALGVKTRMKGLSGGYLQPSGYDTQT